MAGRDAGALQAALDALHEMHVQAAARHAQEEAKRAALEKARARANGELVEDSEEEVGRGAGAGVSM